MPGLVFFWARIIYCQNFCIYIKKRRLLIRCLHLLDRNRARAPRCIRLCLFSIKYLPIFYLLAFGSNGIIITRCLWSRNPSAQNAWCRSFRTYQKVKTFSRMSVLNQKTPKRRCHEFSAPSFFQIPSNPWFIWFWLKYQDKNVMLAWGQILFARCACCQNFARYQKAIQNLLCLISIKSMVRIHHGLSLQARCLNIS
jgi:hypothetical protein